MKKTPEQSTEQLVEIPTRAGSPLGGTLFIPREPIGQSMVISSATGMLQKFYFAFARYFAGCGYTVLTFDYRGIGRSGGTPDALRREGGDLIAWGANDQAGAVRYLKDYDPGAQLTVVTHSIGGQVCGFNPEHGHIDRIIMAASQNSYWNYFKGWHRIKMWSFWNIMIPWTTPFFGYFPAKHLGLFENLPKGMVRQWRSWGKQPDYMMAFRDASYLFDDLTMPILSLSFPADPLAPPKTVDWLAAQYPNARVERIHYTDEGDAPGHFGYFRPPFKDTLWNLTHQWILTGTWRQATPGDPGNRPYGQ
jgi:predicted alpha/beta hydrolase